MKYFLPLFLFLCLGCAVSPEQVESIDEPAVVQPPVFEITGFQTTDTDTHLQVSFTFVSRQRLVTHPTAAVFRAGGYSSETFHADSVVVVASSGLHYTVSANLGHAKTSSVDDEPAIIQVRHFGNYPDTEVGFSLGSMPLQIHIGKGMTFLVKDELDVRAGKVYQNQREREEVLYVQREHQLEAYELQEEEWIPVTHRSVRQAGVPYFGQFTANSRDTD